MPGAKYHQEMLRWVRKENKAAIERLYKSLMVDGYSPELVPMKPEEKGQYLRKQLKRLNQMAPQDEARLLKQAEEFADSV